MARRVGRSGAGEEASGLAARKAAVALLQAVLTRRQPLDAALEQSAAAGRLGALDPRDRAFARAIAATGLRRKGQIDAILDAFLDKGMPGQGGPLPEILLAAAAQLLFLGAAPHAAIGLAVQHCKEDRAARRFDRLANAVLRRVAAEGPSLVAGQDAARLNAPDWLWRRWHSTYGEAAARAMAEAHLIEPALDLSVRSDPQAWAQRLGGHALPTGTVRFGAKGRIEALPGYAEGAWWVQDAAAALPARLLGDVRAKRVADLCAAPGGKTAQLAAAGARVTAVDQSEARLARLKANLDRLRLEADIVAADVRDWRPDAPFDAVLLDAPCMATGTIRRHPDIPHLKRPADLEALTQIQAAMLDRALEFLRPGGTLIYCVCSLEPEEGEEQAMRLLARRPDVAHVPVAAGEVAGRADWISPEGYLRTLPHLCADEAPEMSGLDGFFAARLSVGQS